MQPLPARPVPDGFLEKRLERERAFLLEAPPQAQCSICGFPGGRSLRGLEVDGKFVKVCQVCHFQHDWVGIPDSVPLAPFPEVSLKQHARFLHYIYYWMRDENGAREGDNLLRILMDRSVIGAQELGFDGGVYLNARMIRDAYWKLPPSEQGGAHRLFSVLRVIPSPDAFRNAYAYWMKAVYPSLDWEKFLHPRAA